MSSVPYWYDIATLERHGYRHDINWAWFGGHYGKPEFAVVVGQGGYVWVQRLDGTSIEQSVTPMQDSTSLMLIKTWGVRPDKYWVMDKNGTVWERDGDRTRVVVRGLYRENVEIYTAWVSPTGSVFAGTKEHLYELE